MVIAEGGLFVLTGSTGGGSGSGGGSAEGAEPRRPGRLRKRAQVSTERRIIDEHWHDRVAHALLTVGSGSGGGCK